MNEINLLVAFGAGLVSFLAPCVVPLLPLYISFVSGVSVQELTNGDGQKRFLRRIILTSLVFTVGFSMVFVALGFGASKLGMGLFSNRTVLSQMGGIMIIVFGAYLLGIFQRLTVSQKSFSITLPESVRRIKILGPFLIGVIFALTWTPCAGPILGAILTLALTSPDQMAAGTLLFVYAMGIAIPFLIVSLSIGVVQKYLVAGRSWLGALEKVAGAVLIGMGVLIATDQFRILTTIFSNFLYQLPIYKEVLLRV